MCFNFEVSIGTFLTSWTISLYLLNKGITDQQKEHIIFLMMFSSMQLVDAILWYNGMKKNNVNYITTSFLVPLVLVLQILYKVFVVNDNKNTFITVFVAFYIGYIFYRFNGYSKSLCGSTLSSPIWGGKELNILELTPFILLILYPNYTTILQVFALLFLIKILVGGAYGSLWCAVGNIMALYYLYKY